MQCITDDVATTAAVLDIAFKPTGSLARQQHEGVLHLLLEW
jgi:hypothetical protein